MSAKDGTDLPQSAPKPPKAPLKQGSRLDAWLRDDVAERRREIRIEAGSDRRSPGHVHPGHKSANELAEAVTAIERSGGNAVAVRADVSDPGELRGVFDAVEAHFGALDVVVSNAGTARFGPLVDAADDDFDTIFATNTRAGFVALREAAASR